MNSNSHILAHYDTGYEAERLLNGPGQLERARTEELLTRYLPAAPAVVLDVGGGPGVYSRWLAARNYEVRLIDIVPLHVELANQSFTESGFANARADIGDARKLGIESNSQHAVLLMGPLYHLQDRTDRQRALHEAWRVLAPGGLLVAAAISKYASLFDGMSRLLVRDPRFVEILDADLRGGKHENPTDRPDYFTTAFLHHPEELRAELTEADFREIDVLGVEGPFWVMSSFDELWSDAKLREMMLGYLRQIEKEPSLLGASAHLLAFARKAP